LSIIVLFFYQAEKIAPGLLKVAGMIEHNSKVAVLKLTQE